MESGESWFYGLSRPEGTRSAYLENEDTKAPLEVFMLLDQLCIEEKIVHQLAVNISCAREPHNEIHEKDTASE